MLFNIPISLAKADRIIRLLSVTTGNHVLDAGCGQGEFLIRVLESGGATGLGIDIDPEAIKAAQQKAAGRIPVAFHQFRTADMQQETLAEGTFDLAICLGATHAFGEGEAAYPNSILALTRLVRPGGRLLIGEGYWKQPPAPAYLRLIGEPLGIYRDHAANVSYGQEQGLVPLYAAVSNEDEWDHFEWSHRLRIEQEAARFPADPTWTEKLKRSREWRDGYLRWGRSTMGFGLYLFEKPAAV